MPTQSPINDREALKALFQPGVVLTKEMIDTLFDNVALRGEGGGGGDAPPITDQIATKQEAETGTSNSVLMSPLRTFEAIKKLAIGTVATSVNTLGKLYTYLVNTYWTRTQSDERYIQSAGGGGVPTEHAATSNEILVGSNTTKVVTPKGLSGATYVLRQNQLAFYPITTTSNVGVTGGAVISLRVDTAALAEITLAENEKVMSLLLSASDSYGNKVEAVIDLFKKTGDNLRDSFSISLQQNHGKLEVKALKDLVDSDSVPVLHVYLGTRQHIDPSHKYSGNAEVKYLSGLERTNIFSGHFNIIYNTLIEVETYITDNWNASEDVEYETPFIVINDRNRNLPYLIGATRGIVFEDQRTTGRVNSVRSGVATLNFSLPTRIAVNDYITSDVLNIKKGYIQIRTVSKPDPNSELYNVTFKWSAYAVADGLVDSASTLGTGNTSLLFPTNSDHTISRGKQGAITPEVGLLTEINPISSPTDAQKRDGVRSIDTIVTDRESGWPAKLSSHEQALHKGGITTDNLAPSFNRGNKIQKLHSDASGGTTNSIKCLFDFNTSDRALPSPGASYITTQSVYRMLLLVSDISYVSYIYVVGGGTRFYIFTSDNNKSYTNKWTQNFSKDGRSRITEQDIVIGGLISAGGGDLFPKPERVHTSVGFNARPISCRASADNYVGLDYLSIAQETTHQYAVIFANYAIFNNGTNISSNARLSDNIQRRYQINGAATDKLYMLRSYDGATLLVEELMYRNESVRLIFKGQVQLGGSVSGVQNTVSYST